MPYVTREDGERFVIPSYRDVISAKKPSLLKKEILLLCASHGEYITLQRKNVEQYEVAFSNEPGYLLGETVWQYFKRPQDLIYCEAIPNTTEAILVIVKSGSVYLDGSFPVDSIADELVIFRTQKNSFDIYVYGDVPISDTPQEDKFALDSTSVRSFTVLEKPVFPTLPIVKAFQLQRVNVVLESHGIGVLPIKKILAVIVGLGLLWMGFNYLTTHKKQLPTVMVGTSNPYQNYITAMSTPDPSEGIIWLSNAVSTLFTIPGWYPIETVYSNGVLLADMKSLGTRTDVLTTWAQKNHAVVGITTTGFTISMIDLTVKNRPAPTYIYSVSEVVANLVDKLSYIVPGNNIQIGKLTSQPKYNSIDLTITFSGITPTTLELLGQNLAQLPVVLTEAKVTLAQDGSIGGTISLRVLGN